MGNSGLTLVIGDELLELPGNWKLTLDIIYHPLCLGRTRMSP